MLSRPKERNHQITNILLRTLFVFFLLLFVNNSISLYHLIGGMETQVGQNICHSLAVNLPKWPFSTHCYEVAQIYEPGRNSMDLINRKFPQIQGLPLSTPQPDPFRTMTPLCIYHSSFEALHKNPKGHGTNVQGCLAFFFSESKF